MWSLFGPYKRMAERLHVENEELRDALHAREERIDKLMKLVAALRDVNADLDAAREKEMAHAGN